MLYNIFEFRGVPAVVFFIIFCLRTKQVTRANEILSIIAIFVFHNVTKAFVIYKGVSHIKRLRLLNQPICRFSNWLYSHEHNFCSFQIPRDQYYFDMQTLRIHIQLYMFYGVFFSTKKCALYLKKCNFVFVSQKFFAL